MEAQCRGNIGRRQATHKGAYGVAKAAGFQEKTFKAEPNPLPPPGGGFRFSEKGRGKSVDEKKDCPTRAAFYENRMFLAGDCRQESVDLEDVIIQRGLKASVEVEHGLRICSI